MYVLFVGLFCVSFSGTDFDIFGTSSAVKVNDKLDAYQHIKPPTPKGKAKKKKKKKK